MARNDRRGGELRWLGAGVAKFFREVEATNVAINVADPHRP